MPGSSKQSVTGRDDYLIAKALLYAITFIESLPEQQRELSDRDDMVALLNHVVPAAVEREELVRSLEQRTGFLPDIARLKSIGR